VRILRGLPAAVLASVILCGVPSVASACLNDSDTPTYEEDFREQYQPESPSAEQPAYHLAGIGTGSVLMAAVAGTLVVRRRQR
jgi:hypothetical protein